ncbi:MAG: NUDIX domain-containing protein [Clostridia bacterium]|nr:NUDIX domain-containing protein [Clostridia bacterium]
MKIIEIFDGNYSKDKAYDFTRYAVRAVIINNGKLFVEYASTPKMVMLPGGGVENGESNDECVIRECKEECGLVVEPIKELFAIREYYHDVVFFSTYTLCRIVGECEKSYTDNEISLNLVCKWQDCEEIIRQIKALMKEYEDGDEELYGCHYREYLALNEIASIYKDII